MCPWSERKEDVGPPPGELISREGGRGAPCKGSLGSEQPTDKKSPGGQSV